MRRMLRTALGAALAVAASVPARADGPAYPPGPAPMSSGQDLPIGIPAAGGTNPEGGSPGNSAGPAGPTPGAPGPVGPDGFTPSSPGQSGGSGAFADGGGPDASPGFAPGLGGIAGASGAPPGIIGDFTPITQSRVAGPAFHALQSARFPNLPTPIPAPGINGHNPGIVSGNGTTSVLFKFAGLKISDNQSPRPQDRFFYSFNYFDNLNASVNRRIGSPIENLQVYHQLFGIEKTFLDGRASIGFRMPLNTITLKSTANVPGLGGTSTAPGDLSVFVKYLLWDDRKGNLISAGLQVTPPTGPGAFGGRKYYSFYRDTQIQPFIGYIFTRDRFFIQGFSAIDVPTQSQDVTLLFNDVAVGYYAYRPTDPSRFVTAIVPTAEAHLTTPLNHRGFSPTDLASTPDVLSLTFGTNLELRRRATITAAYVTPVTGPKPFNAELVLLLNVRFGASARGRGPNVPLAR